MSAPAAHGRGPLGRRDLVLVGGGHAHVQVLRRAIMEPLADVRLSIVLDRPVAVYSGMVPGFVAGDYAAHELEIDLVPLARRARARVILAAATRIDTRARRIELEGRDTIAYDVASLDVGSSVRGLDLPGVAEHALSTRPIGDFVDRLDERLARLPARPRVALVGGGAAGCELVLTVAARLRHAGREPALVLVADSAGVLPGGHPRFARRVRAELEARGTELRLETRVASLDATALVLDDGTRIDADLVIWATGAAPVALLAASDLPRDARGFVPVDAQLRVVGVEDVFAVGDCAALAGVPKAGVYAVRQGPVLDRNLRAHLSGSRGRRYRPQRDFLVLLNAGGGRAIGSKWGVVAAGRAVFRLKDAIDRRFMRRFQVLGSDGAPASDFPSAESMGMGEMPCGGCAAKLDAASLDRALASLAPAPEDERVVLGLAASDDAAAFRTRSGDLLLASVDGFRAFADDPWLVGRVAAVNALNDVLAKGGQARHALALVGLAHEPAPRSEETLRQVLAGVRAALDPLGVSLLGGHTTVGDELFVALTVMGEASDRLLTLEGARAGDALLLTRPLGSGVLLAADMQGRAPGPWVEALYRDLVRPSHTAARIAFGGGARACTDVSGFGLARHLSELLRASRVDARIDPAVLPGHVGARRLLALGLRSTFHQANRALAPDLPTAPGDPDHELLFDPQTAGGLLLSVPAEASAPMLDALHAAGEGAAACIGQVIEPASGGGRIVLGPL